MVSRRNGRGVTHDNARRNWILIAVVAVVLAGIPNTFRLPSGSGLFTLPLIVSAIAIVWVGARYAALLSLVAVLVTATELLTAPKDTRWIAFGHTLLVLLGAAILIWTHRRQQRRLQQRARARRLIVGRVKDRAKQLQRTGSELRQAVERSEVAQRTLLEHLPVHVLQKDLEGRFTFVSQSFGKLLNRDIHAILGKTDYDFYEQAIADKFRQDDLRVMLQGAIVDDVERTQLADGRIAYMQVRKAPLRDHQGNIVGVQGIFWDVTEALSGKKQLQRIESWAHALIQAALDAVLIVDAEGQVLEANPAAETILGYRHDQSGQHPPLGDIMHTIINEDVHVDPGSFKTRSSFDSQDNQQPVQESLNQLLKSATGRRIEVRLRRRDDTWFEAEISAHPLVVENSSGWAIFIRDITRRKRSVTELQAAKEAAERANLAKSEFVANVSHELRTPLTGIIGLHELLGQTELDEQQQDYLTLAKTSSNTLLSLIDALLDFSKIEAQRLELEHEPFDLLECVENAGSSLAARAQLRGLELVVDFDPNVPDHVFGDEQRVRQILLNLIGNAIKFSEKGDIQVRLRRLPSDPTSDTQVTLATDGTTLDVCAVQFEVIDAGIGIDQSMQAVIFEAFQQADSSTTRRYGGTGLGLAICRELVHLMGGEISVHSAPQQGSNFTFTLPLQLSSDIERKHTIKNIDVALAASPSLWRTVLERDLIAMGYRVRCISTTDLIQREPKQLFSAGNHTIILADYRELYLADPKALPVVERVILVVPLATARPSQVIPWLRHVDCRWLNRPIRHRELVSCLRDGSADVEKSQAASRIHIQTQPAKVLLVEDSPINQTVLKGMLGQLGHVVHLARNGLEAVELCAQQDFDVVLMDIQMPEVDGLEATRRIRLREQKAGTRQIPIIALTAHAMPRDRELAKGAGMNGFLVKPIPLDSLRAAVSTAIDSAEHQSLQEHLTTESPLDEITHVPVVDKQELQTAREVVSEQFEQFLAKAPTWDQVILSLGGNQALAHEVVSLLAMEVPRLANEMRRYHGEKNLKEVRRAAHTLKSNLRQVGLVDAALFAEYCEKLALSEKFEELSSEFFQLDELESMLIKWCSIRLSELN